MVSAEVSASDYIKPDSEDVDDCGCPDARALCGDCDNSSFYARKYINCLSDLRSVYCV